MKYTPIEELDIELLKKHLEPTMNEKFLKICLDALDTKVSPNNPVPDEVSCARDMSILIQKVLPDFKTQDSTKMLDWQLFQDKRFVRLVSPVKGSIWVYPAKTDPKGAIIVNGHTLAQITEERLASNNSFGVNKGKFTGNYTIEEARKEFITKRGLKEYIYGFKD